MNIHNIDKQIIKKKKKDFVVIVVSTDIYILNVENL